MPDVVAADPAAQTGPTDVALAAGAAAPTGPGDAAAAPVACRCCGATLCPDYVKCSPWPPDHITFTIGGLTEKPLGEEGSAACCGTYTPTGSTGSPGYAHITNLADCFNRTYAAPYRFSFLNEMSFDLVTCRDIYRGLCLNDVFLPHDPYSPPYGDTTVQYAIEWSVVITSSKNLVTGEQFPVTVQASVIGGWYGGFINEFQGASFYNQSCEAFASYQKDFPVAEFDCAGPWVLDLVANGDGGVIPTNPMSGWPGTITLTPSFTGPRPPAFVTGCCAPTPEPCPTAPPDATFNCDTAIGCIDPGDGSGFYTGPTAEADCHTACVPSRYSCIGGVCQPTFGGTFDSWAACDASGCGHGDEPIGDDSCCPPESPPPGVMSLVTSCPAAGGCLDLVTSTAWNAALKAFVTGLPACGTFVNLYLFCVAGSINFAIDCGAGLIFADHIALEDGSGLCGPAAFVHANVTFPGAGVCGGLPPGTSLTMGLGYDASGIVP
jgi:hypothetical protein